MLAGGSIDFACKSGVALCNLYMLHGQGFHLSVGEAIKKNISQGQFLHKYVVQRFLKNEDFSDTDDNKLYILENTY